MLPPPDLSNANAVPLGRPPPPSYQPPKRRRAHPPKKTKAKRKPTVLPTLDVSPARQHARPELDNADERERKRTRWASPAPPRPPRRDSPSPPPLPHPQPSRPSRLPKLRIPPALLDVPSRPSSAAKRMPPALLDRLAPLPSPPRVASRSPSPPPPPPAIEVQLPLWERHPAPAPAPVSPMSPTPSLTPDLSPSCASSSSSASFADLAGDTPLAPTRFTYFPLPAAAQEEGMKKGKEKEERERGWTRCLAYADLPRLLAVEAATADEPPPVPSHSLAHPDLRPPSRPSSALRSNRNPQTGRGSFDPLLVAPAVRPAAPVPAAPSGTAYATGWWRFRTPQEVAVSQYCSARVYVGAPWGFGGGGRGWR
ncbi:hypothetical protein JCM8097_003509 [Rhodosporidiobolus ruineniae]